MLRCKHTIFFCQTITLQNKDNGQRNVNFKLEKLLKAKNWIHISLKVWFYIPNVSVATSYSFSRIQILFANTNEWNFI